MDTPEVLIVGAGLSGLAAGALLARDGVKVTLVEQAEDVGGKLAGLTRDGFSLDAGLHCFHYGDSGPIGELNSRLGLGLKFIENRNSGYLLRGKDRLPVPAGDDVDFSQVPGFSEDEAARIKKLFAALSEADPAAWAKKSVADFVSESGFGEDELISDYASALSMTVLGMNGAGVSAELLISHVKAVGHSGFHLSVIEGGASRLVEALARVISEREAMIVLGSKVHEIVIEEGSVIRVKTSSEEYTPKTVIYSGPLQYLPEVAVGEGINATLARKCAKLTPVSGIALEFGLAGPVSDVMGVMIDPRESVIGRFPSNLDPGLAPEGGQLSSWMALVNEEDLIDKKVARAHIKRLKRIVKKQFPEIADKVKWERLRTIPNISGAAPLPRQPRSARPKVAVKGVKNLFLAGDEVAAEGVLSGVAAASAIQAAGLAVKYLEKLGKEMENQEQT